MSATTDLRTQVLDGLDPLLARDGFRRSRALFEWRRSTERRFRDSLHLNFGVYVEHLSAIPSLGVHHPEVGRVLVALGDDAAARGPVFSARFDQLSGGPYEANVANGPAAIVDVIWADYCSAGRTFLSQARNLDAAVDNLSGPPKAWWCVARFHQARLLPATLLAAGRTHEALEQLALLEVEVREQPQAAFGYPEFAQRFRALIASGQFGAPAA